MKRLEHSGIAGPAHTPTFCPWSLSGRLVPSSALSQTTSGKAGGPPEPGPEGSWRCLRGWSRDLQGCSCFLSASVCLPVVPGALSAPPVQLGPKLVSVLWLDGFSTFFFFLIFSGPAKLSALCFTTRKGLGIRLPEVPWFRSLQVLPPSPSPEHLLPLCPGLSSYRFVCCHSRKPPGLGRVTSQSSRNIPVRRGRGEGALILFPSHTHLAVAQRC